MFSKQRISGKANGLHPLRRKKAILEREERLTKQVRVTSISGPSPLAAHPENYEVSREAEEKEGDEQIQPPLAAS